jgi:hypothetical protein
MAPPVRGRQDSTSDDFSGPYVNLQQPAVPPGSGQASFATTSFNLLRDKNILPPSPVRAPVPALPEHQRGFNCSTKIMRSTLTAVPTTAALLAKTKMPFGLHIYPYGTDVCTKGCCCPVVCSQVVLTCGHVYVAAARGAAHDHHPLPHVSHLHQPVCYVPLQRYAWMADLFLVFVELLLTPYDPLCRAALALQHVFPRARPASRL